ncbi:MAG: hypothetical protein M1517_02105 [Deltaproteobacteria bacterium]|nr:hypothetical protein [Deltaproteobacteria bacterium]
MKKTRVIGVAIIMGLVLAGAVHAMGSGMCGEAGAGVANINIESVRSFLKDTSVVRDELIIKRIELLKERRKADVNYDRMATIKKSIIDLRTKIMDTAKKYGLDKEIECLMGMRRRAMMMERGMKGQGSMGPEGRY